LLKGSLSLLILLSISYAQTGYGYLKLKNGKALQVEIIGVYEQAVYYELLLPFEKGNIYSTPCDEIVNILDRENNPIELDCSKNTLNSIDMSLLKRKSETQINLSAIGSVLIAASGAIGLINNNRDCDDCTVKELDDYLDSQKFWGNIHYATLAIGGILLLIDSNNNQKTINK